MRALVVFVDESRHPLRRLLKPGFHHVFTALRQDEYWITVDAARGLPDIRVVANADYDLAGMYRHMEYIVLEAMRGDQAIRVPFVRTSCVGLTKAVLGIRSMAVTPWQLYKHLRGTI